MSSTNAKGAQLAGQRRYNRRLYQTISLEKAHWHMLSRASSGRSGSRSRIIVTEERLDFGVWEGPSYGEPVGRTLSALERHAAE